MTVLLAFAFLSGIITILSPCILPVLPIVLSGTTGGGKARPYGILAGFVVSFTAFTLALSALVRATGISADALRIVAVVIIALFGLVLLVPQLATVFERFASRLARLGDRIGSSARKVERAEKTVGASGDSAAKQSAGASGKPSGKPITGGFLTGLPVGLSLGLVWTPCVGPIMASVISLAVTQAVDGGAVLITLAYTLGTSIPMLAVMLGGRALLNKVPFLSRNTGKVQRVFGVLMLVTAVAIGFGWDRRFQSVVLDVFPSYGTGLTAVEENPLVREALDERIAYDLAEEWKTGGQDGDRFSYENVPKNGKLEDFGRAPELVTEGQWLNTGGFDIPETMEDLRGKVVIVDFWTYSCINCVRTLPYLREWYERYRDQGLVILGVHTPEFEFEKNPNNVRKAIDDLGVTWPVVLDNEYTQWRAYRNRYWPAHYFIDAEGRVRYFHFGEGEYDTSERVIRELLEESGASVRGGRVSGRDPGNSSRTPETYLGYSRAKNFISEGTPSFDTSVEYTPAGEPENGEWSLDGVWAITSEYVVPEEKGTLEIGFHAKDVFLVIDPEEAEGSIEVLVDGEPVENTADVADGLLEPTESRLYHLVSLEKPGEHTLTLEVSGNLKLYAFTFG